MVPTARSLSLLGIVATFLVSWLAVEPAQACACCSNRASRYVAVEPISGQRLHEIEQMNFAGEAFLATGEADAPPEFQEFGSSFTLAVARTHTQLDFSFRGAADSVAILTLVVPATISIFQVDPRGGEPEGGLGPVLYKEWQLTADAGGRGTGVFRTFAGPGQTLSLILHGRGRGCTDAEDFTDWTLLLDGPSGRLTLYGALTSTSR